MFKEVMTPNIIVIRAYVVSFKSSQMLGGSVVIGLRRYFYVLVIIFYEKFVLECRVVK